MEKKSFKDRWKDRKYQAKVKLIIYSIFVFCIFVIVINDNSVNDINNDKVLDNNILDDKVAFYKKDVDKYKCIITIKYNNSVIKYDIDVNESNYYIVKQLDEISYVYKYKDNRYYKKINDNYVLTDIGSVFDKIDYDYVNIDVINNYLLYSEKIEDKYIVYIKDIILDSDSGNYYITFNMGIDSIEIDYTNLYNYLNDNQVDKLIVYIEYIY